MTTLPPPIPGAPSQPRKSVPPPPIGGGPAVKPTVINPEDYDHAKPWPILLASVALVASLVITIFFRHETAWFYLLGYLLTPFVAIFAMGLDVVSQRRQSITNEFFLENRKFTKIVRVLGFISVLLAIPHIEGLATAISAWLANPNG